MILVSDSATPSAIVNQSACTEPHPAIGRRALVSIRAYPCLTRVELHRIRVVLRRAPFHTQRDKREYYARFHRLGQATACICRFNIKHTSKKIS